MKQNHPILIQRYMNIQTALLEEGYEIAIALDYFIVQKGDFSQKAYSIDELEAVAGTLSKIQHVPQYGEQELEYEEVRPQNHGVVVFPTVDHTHLES